VRTLLCVDAFAGSEAPVAWLERFGPDEPSPLCIVPVPRSRPVSFASSARLRLFDELIAARSRRACDAARERLRPRWPLATVDLIDGDASEQLLRSAERWGAELVVLDGTARGATSPALAAGVVRMAARHLECSVLVVNRVPDAVREIVLGMDGSPGAREAVRLLSRFRFDPAPRLLALGVVNSWWRETIPEAELPTAISRELAEVEAREAAHLRSMLTRTTAILTGTVNNVETTVGAPADSILQATRERAADLLVIGHQGIERVRRLPLGSVAESLLSAAPCSILIGRK